ncbi:hypothetical protein CcaverHIS641_0306880 [Cutaneotrichosporon cavernicola]|nr:hypothetical protein CcaverHIS641_0306880 [Cutaneotrichosporon cavernicola]
MIIPIEAAQAALSLASLASPHVTDYSVSAGRIGEWTHPDDTPAMSFLDSDGTYYYQSSDASYGITQTRQWHFWTGADMDHSAEAPISHAKNYCDLMGLWVDPDSGDWFGLIHNEFTPAPFGDRMHFDAIDLAVSKDHGATWDIRQHIITSPYDTIRNDTTTFPGDTYYWGAGDQRFLADIRSGYFYIWYGSRVVDKGTNGTWHGFGWHVARARMDRKLEAGSWSKFYDGKWIEPGLGGKESSLFPIDYQLDGWDGAWEDGYIAPEREYDPHNSGSGEDQIARGLMPPTSPLFWMDVSYNAYLGLYIGQPSAIDKNKSSPQKVYATNNLDSQRWFLLGDTGDYKTTSAYRFMLDSVSRTGQWILGKVFRGYCSFGCSAGDAEYVEITVDGPRFEPVDTGVYRISGLGLGEWRFEPTGDGAYTIHSTGYLGVRDIPSDRAWNTRTRLLPTPGIGTQWWVIPAASGDKIRLVNRYSGLALAITKHGAVTVPQRSWDGARTAAEQELVLTPV